MTRQARLGDNQYGKAEIRLMKVDRDQPRHELHDLTVSVITGPVLHEDDPHYRGVALPRQFFKLVAMVTTTNNLVVTAYLLSQEALLDEFTTAPEEFSFGAYRTTCGT